MKKIFFLVALNSLFVVKSNFAQSIASGVKTCVSLCNDGTLMGWGENYSGLIGNGTTIDSNVPLAVSFLSGVVAVTNDGAFHYLALKNDSTVWAWGINAGGQLGDGTNTDRTTPVQTNLLSGVISIGGGRSHSFAIKNDGTFWAWGQNSNGQFGNGTTTNSNIPIQITTITNVISAKGGSDYSVALKSDSTVWAWGSNSDGLGDGITTSTTIPVQAIGLSGIISIAGGEYHSLALKMDGTVWAWGKNTFGQLGDGTTTTRTTAVQITSLSGIVAISAGNKHSVALKNDGTVWAWGYNIDGLLGNGTTTSSSIPVQVNGLSSITAISAGDWQSLAIKNDGTEWAWGSNFFGQLGNGTNSATLVPVQTVGLCSVSGSSNCIANYSTSYDSVFNTFSLNVDSITAAMAVSYHWDFGDGTTSTISFPSHVYLLDSLYNVCMTVYTSAGDSCTFCHIMGKDSAGNITRTPGFTINVYSPNIITGISQTQTNSAQIIIYPNPNNGIFNIAISAPVKNANLEVYNSLGALVHKQKIINQESVIELSTQPQGLYFVKIVSDNKIVGSKKIIKE